ncbi:MULTISPECIES: ketopantoate reductase family protein [Aminobacterium]|jgi:2-dehydropantoate 2-reductase|uniref:ketopantoate reductase family protein n=1 Tax=Aminobacterium TaxID=81466 RepID=UPI0016B71678|nr:2-dehydropantoate 2-reductase [Aminobacterium sp. EBM-42]MDD2378958.1 2-dehydropantoate 2-reductase [Aminobacterium colombiense]MDD3767491.1 2-dehydropantoate 2-reductase [Aminobacterium colombiense]MDD4265597.1 2-dehydropantoate 2-reductase [Aminobacterium colombiense]MDD4586567.1 2-dehydropantoate 2-reductase [Aminobacterium colombiense]NLK30594.1 2-dehydropantoate 2-reductase [Aminobacterium colombiense]
MRICIAGLGGVGGYFGGRLAVAYETSAEHEISFLCRGEHMNRIREKGLVVTTPQETFVAHPRVVSDSPAEIGCVDVLFFAVKGYHLQAFAKAARPLCHNQTLLIPLGNGVDNADILCKEKIPGILFNGCVYISAFIASPGEIHQVGGNCKMIVGPVNDHIEKHRSFEKVMKEGGILFELTPEIDLAVWIKFIFMSPMAAVTTLKRASFGEVLSQKRTRDMVLNLMKEVESLAQEKGIALPGNIVAASLEKAQSFPPETRSSMELDASKGRPTELETFVGAVVRLAEDAGISVPLYEKVYKALLQE